MSQREEKSQGSAQESDTFYTTLNLDMAFVAVEEKVNQWKQDAKEKDVEQKGILSSVRKLLGNRTPSERFTDFDRQPPRLLSLSDITGTIYFEFIEVEAGGTVIKATYNTLLRGRMIKLKAELPLKIPATPVGLNCPSCGKPVLHEFNLCPYCGTKLIKE